eukprot:gene11956-16004_t
MTTISYVVIGGGIAGVCCAQELLRLVEKSHHENCTGSSYNSNGSMISVILISESDIVREVASVMKITNHLEELQVFERTADCFKYSHPNINIIIDKVDNIDYKSKVILLKSGQFIHYHKVCICTGGRPNMIISNHPLVIGIRDLESVQYLSNRLKSARNIVIVGNGGIAVELIYELQSVPIDWIIKDNYIGNTFFDASASEFIMPALINRAKKSTKTNNIINQAENLQPTSELVKNLDNLERSYQYALGPDWINRSGFDTKSYSNLNSQIVDNNNNSSENNLMIHYQQEVIAFRNTNDSTWTFVKFEAEEIIFNQNNINYHNPQFENADRNWPLYILTSNNEVIGCDVLVSVTGIKPNTEFLVHNNNGINNNGAMNVLNDDGYVMVNEIMESKIPYVYAAGDCCDYKPRSIVNNNEPLDNFFIQMRLWSQARFMGSYAAQCMCEVNDDYGLDSHFQIFAHLTRFFGYKVVLLGLFNGQGLGDQIEFVTKQFIIDNNKDSITLTDNQNNEYKQSISNTGITITTSNSKAHNLVNETEIWIRMTSDSEYIKLIVHKNRIIGAILIGNTDLEEMIENLILNRLDVSNYGIGLLDPAIDISDYFD